MTILYRLLAEKFGWSPDIVSRMTIPQALMYMVETEKGERRYFRRSKKFGSVSDALNWMRERDEGKN